MQQEEEQGVAATAVASQVPAEDEEEDLLDVKAEEFREFAKYVEDNLRTQVDRECTQSGQEAVDFLAELADAPDLVTDKVRQLAALVRGANHFVIYTGAGISTAAGLPDYRGPKGIWTQRVMGGTQTDEDARGLGQLLAESSLHPTAAHHACKALFDAGYLRFLMTTNVDGLHRRSGFVRSENLAELHGNSFVEECGECGAVFDRDYVVRTAKRIYDHHTGRTCEKCGKQALRDIIVNFGNTVEHVPSMESQYDLAWVNSIKADLFLVLGSSLSVPTACDLPDYCVEKGGKVVIVNKQRTPKDGSAALLIHAPCDTVMSLLLGELNLRA